MPKILHNVREGILLTGRDLLIESGYEEFSVRLVASRCGIGVGTIYNYFPSKQELVAAILYAEWDIHLRRMVQAAKTAEAPREKLEAVFGELCRFVQGVHSVWVGGIVDSAEGADIRNVQHQRAMVRGQLRDIVAACLLTPGRGDAEPWLADCITRLFLAYAGSADAEPGDVSKALGKLLS